MKKILVLLALLATTASGQGFNFPVGQETMANSMPVVIASDQSAIPITGSITATNPSVAPTGGAVPADATYVGMIVSGDLVGLQGTANGLKVDGSAVTQPVSIAATVTTDQVATTAATFQDGSIAAGSLTTSYQTVITTGGALVNVAMRNSTNGIVVVSLNGGSSTSYTLSPGDQIIVDLKILGRNIAASTNLQAKYSGTAPTTGSIFIDGVY